ncbi:YhgE/Pip domain-containing protein [Paenibacillus sp. S150]|uniref:YhgE/Pip domain-containing protein n=1 Tax=Paenibacillus sp. S150 TaxID=2749826 RepID=UPI001C55D9B0|nr:YhgE/Pip domain-containing protein [Paenibacillus sp. S150]MBW4081400.1 YhgE/Pip domain-containing protein [Paenibacillus sp. S150]
MKSLSVFTKDLAAVLKKPKVLIPMFVVLFIPVLYSGLFLKAFWDPYGKMNELPVAVVNEDKGADYEGTKLAAGNDLVEELKKTDGFKWNFVTRAQAEAGMKDETYYMTIVVPEDFSANATTLLDANPQPARIIYEPNEGYNFLAGQIGGTAVKDIKTKVSAKITEAYATSVFDKITDIAGGLGEAGDGAAKIADGAAKLDDGALKLQDNLLVLTEGTGKLLEGAAPLTQGAADLNTGAAALQTGSSTLAGGLRQLSAAHKQLQDGAVQTADGSKQLNAGLQKTAEGAAALQAGTKSAVDGTAKLQAGTQSVVDGSAKLEAGLASSVDGSAKLEEGLKASKDGSAKVSAGAQAVAAGLQQLAQSNPQLAASPEVQQLLAASTAVAQGTAQLDQSQQQLLEGAAALHSGQEQLVQGADQLHAGSQQLDAGVSQLHDGAQQLNAGSTQLLQGQQQLLAGAGALETGGSKLAAGMQQFGAKLDEAAAGGAKLAAGGTELEAGTAKLLDGAGQLSSGLGSVADGSKQLSDGAGQLKDGLGDLKAGSGELASKLGDAASQTGSVKTSDALVSMFAQPVQLEEKEFTTVANYGTGFAPYFLSLGLFVGALICTIVVPMRESEVIGASRFNRFISRTLTFSMMSLLQSLMAILIVLYGLGLNVQNVPLFYAFTFITSIAFMWMIQAIVTWMDQPGRFVVIVLLIFQLTTSAGTFPLELIPGWMKFFNPLLPMTYSVRGFKAVISTGDYSVMWSDAGLLGIYGIVFLAFTFTYFITRDRDSEVAVKNEQVMTV